MTMRTMTGDGDLKDPITSRNMLIIDQKRPFAEGAFLMRMSDVVAFFCRPDTESICYSPLDTVAAEGSTYDSVNICALRSYHQKKMINCN